MAIDREKVLQAAQKFVEKKKYDKAVLEYQKLIHADPNDARTLLKVGDLQSKMGLHAEAISTYEAVANLYAKQGWALKAIAVYKQVKELIQRHVPQLEERYSHLTPKLAELYQQLGLISDALAALDEMATRFQRHGRDGEAIDVFRRIVQLDPTNPLPHLRLAEALSRVQDIEGALYEFKTAAAQLAGLGRRDDALKVLERLLHFRPDPEQARIAAEIYLSRGQPQDGMQALSKLQICFQANPKDLDTLALLSRAFHVIGQGQKAVEVQKEMARIAKEIGRIDVARNILTELMRIAPHDETVQRLASQSVFPQSGAVMPPLPIPQQTPPPNFGGPQRPVRADTRPFGQTPEPARPMPPLPPSVPTAQAGFPPARPATGGFVYDDPAAAPPPPPRRPMADLRSPDVLDPSGQTDATYEIYEDDIEEADVDELLEDSEGVDNGPNDVVDLDGDEPGARREHDDLDREAPEPPPVPVFGEPSEAVARILQDATGYRNMGMFDRAAERLIVALDDEPRSLDLRVALRDTYFEADRISEAVEEMVNIAGLYVESLDGEAAATVLQDVLAYEPQNVRALAMLSDLGYEVVDDGQGAAAEPAPAEEAFDADPNEPLPAYDLDDSEAAEPAPNSYVPRSAKPPSLRAKARGSLPPIGQIDEPFPESQSGDPLPSFDMESSVDYDVGRAETTADDPHGLPTSALAQVDLDEALEEAEFFASRGMYRDARNILGPHYDRNPHNPLLAERIAELDDLLDRRSASGAQGLDTSSTEDRAFDIAASLDALDGIESLAPGPSPLAGAEQQIDVEEVFLKFKEGVAKQISIEDSESHYNLGIAYKEMGLTDDAIREFETAARDPQRECVCCAMVGMIEVERGRIRQAIDAFQRGLAATVLEREHETMLAYEVGVAYEAMKMSRDALGFYQRAMRLDPAYRDVADRVRRLSSTDAKPAPMKAAVGADDDFDRAFDDLLGGDK